MFGVKSDSIERVGRLDCVLMSKGTPFRRKSFLFDLAIPHVVGGGDC